MCFFLSFPYDDERVFIINPTPSDRRIDLDGKF